MRRPFLFCWMMLFVLAGLQSIAASEAGKSKEADKKKAKKTVVQLKLNGGYPEGPRSEGLFSELEPSLGSLVSRMDDAAKDADVAAVWLRIESLEFGRGKIHELRAAIARLRKSGKPVLAELASAGPPEYLVAAACGEIAMPPCGMLFVPGVRAEVTFYKGLLDKLGIQFEILQMGKYKGAAEPLSRTDMSKPLRESLEALVDDAYGDMVAAIAADRRLKDDQVKMLVDRGMFTAAAAKEVRLIDRVAYADQLEDALREKLGGEEINVVTDYKKKKIDAEFKGFGGLVKMMELLMGGGPEEKSSAKKKIAVVYAVGPIIEGDSTVDILGESAVGSSTMVKTLRKAAADEKIVAVVLRIDSPGGSALGSDLIWRETVRMKKPVVASMGDVAGSGGYYIAMGAGQIFAEPGTITGSIGVLGGKLVLGGLYDKVGLNTEVISRGVMSGWSSSLRPFTPEERKGWTDLMGDIYHQFVAKAAEGRKMTYEQMDGIAQGRVWSGRMAKEKGLIDHLGTLEDAVAAAKKAAGLKEGEEVDLLILPRPKSIFEQLFGDPTAEIETAGSTAALGCGLSSTATLGGPWGDAVKLLRQAELFRRLLSERTLMWMPYKVELK